MKQDAESALLTIGQLKQMLMDNKGGNLIKTMYRYASNVVSSNPYWYQQRRDLEAICNQIGTPTVFFTVSYADLHRHEVLELIGIKPTDPYHICKKAVDDHAHIVDRFFMHRMEKAMTHLMRDVLCASWLWFGMEYQGRGTVNGHGCAKLKNDPRLLDLAQKLV